MAENDLTLVVSKHGHPPHTHTDTYTDTHGRTHMDTYRHTRTHAWSHTCTHTQRQTWTDRHTHTRTHASALTEDRSLCWLPGMARPLDLGCCGLWAEAHHSRCITQSYFSSSVRGRVTQRGVDCRQGHSRCPRASVGTMGPPLRRGRQSGAGHPVSIARPAFWAVSWSSASFQILLPETRSCT